VTLIELIVAFAASVYGLVCTAWLTTAYDLRRPNFRKERVPSIGGLVFVLFGILFYGYEWLMQGIHVGSAAAYFLVLAGFGVLGLHDDLAGDRSIGGFKGHFGALRRGKLTTGAAKAIGGGAVSLVAAFLIGFPVAERMAAAALLIALSANASNLVDLRPGRCLAAFLTATGLLALTLILSHHAGAGFLLYALAALAFVVYPLDAAGQMMLGDTGSNSIGGIIGVAAALCLPLAWQIGLVLWLIAFHIWCEGHSLTAAIERNPILRRLDRKIGVR
jgi:UDP-GlcNAc:undecaprenyl-phosphate GlcNAc-1-phosphate transferase